MKDARHNGFDCRAMIRKNGTIAGLTKVKAGKKNGTGHISTDVIVIEREGFIKHLDDRDRLKDIAHIAVTILESLGSPFGGNSHQARQDTPCTGSAKDKWEKAAATAIEMIREMSQEFARAETRNRMLKNAAQSNGTAKSIADVIGTLELLIGTHQHVQESVTVEQVSSGEKMRIVVEIPNSSHGTLGAAGIY